MNTFHLATVPLAEPITLDLSQRVRLPGQRLNTGTITLSELDCAFWINVTTKTIHAQIAKLPNALLIYGPEDFQAVAADLPEQHGERVLQVLGSDPASALQALVNGDPLPPPPQRVPREIANWRARAVLELAGLLPAVESAISAMTGPEGIVVRNAWQSGAALARRGSTVSALAPAHGLTEQQVDAMFIQAASLTV